MLAAAFADGDLLRACGERERLGMHERIVEDHVGGLEKFRRPQREEIRRARSGADEIDDTVHTIFMR